MTVLTGSLAKQGIGNHNLLPYWGDIDGYDYLTYLDHGVYESLSSVQAVVVDVMASANAVALGGSVSISYYGDYYNSLAAYFIGLAG